MPRLIDCFGSKCAETTSEYNTIFIYECDENGREITYNLNGHTEAIECLCFSPSGELLASGSSDYSVKLWNMGTHECQQTLTGHSDSVLSICFSRDSRTLVSGSADKSVKLWDVSSGTCVSTFWGHYAGVNCVSLCPNSPLLASGSDDTYVFLWNVETREFVKTLSRHWRTVWSICFSPDGRLFASRSSDGFFKILDMKTMECISDSELPGRGYCDYLMKSLCRCYNSDYVVISLLNRLVLLKTSKGGGYKSIAYTQGLSSPVLSCAFYSPDRKILACAVHNGLKGDILLWNVEESSLMGTLTGHTEYVSCICFSPMGYPWLASATFCGMVKYWNIETGKCVKSLHVDRNCREVKSICFSQDCNVLCTYTESNSDLTLRLSGISDESDSDMVNSLMCVTSAGSCDLVSIYRCIGSEFAIIHAKEGLALCNLGSSSVGSFLESGFSITCAYVSTYEAIVACSASNGSDGRIMIWNESEPSFYTRICLSGYPCDVKFLKDKISTLRFEWEFDVTTSGTCVVNFEIHRGIITSGWTTPNGLGPLLRHLNNQYIGYTVSHSDLLQLTYEEMKSLRENVIRKSLSSVSTNAPMDLNLRGCSLTNNETSILIHQLSLIDSPENNVRSLDLSQNAIDTLPESIGSLSTLQVLNLSENPLNIIPTSIGKLHGVLTELVLDGVHGSFFSSIFYKTVTLRDNGLQKFLCSGGLRRIPLPRVKVHVVGRSKAGKTTLIQRIRGMSSQDDGSTAGIETTAVKLDEYIDQVREKVEVTFLDFAGQYEYYVGHEQFLRVSVGIFILLVDVHLPEWMKHLKYWFQRLEEMCVRKSGSCRLIVCGTHPDKCAVKRNFSFETAVLKMAGDLKKHELKEDDIFQVNITKDDISSIRKRIVRHSSDIAQATDLPLVTNTFVHELEALRDFKREIGPNPGEQLGTNELCVPKQFEYVISKIRENARRKVSGTIGAMEAQTPKDTLRRMLEACDEVLFFGGPESENKVILDPALFRLQVLRHFFRDPEVQRERNEDVAFSMNLRPVLSEVDIAEAEKLFPELANYPIVEFLENMKLCYRISGKDCLPGYLFPSLLSDEYADFIQIDRFRTVLGRKYECGFDIPESLFVRLQVGLLEKNRFFDKYNRRTSQVALYGIWFWVSKDVVVEIMHLPGCFCGLCIIMYIKDNAAIQDVPRTYERVERVLGAALRTQNYGNNTSHDVKFGIFDLSQLERVVLSPRRLKDRASRMPGIAVYSLHELEECRIKGRDVGGSSVQDMLKGQLYGAI